MQVCNITNTWLHHSNHCHHFGFLRKSEKKRDVPYNCWCGWNQIQPMQAIKLEHRESQSMHIAHNVTCLCFILYLASDMGLHYLTFMGRNLEIRKKPTSVRIMNSAVSIVLVFSVITFLLIIFQRITLDELCFLWIFPRWTVILAHTSAGSVSPPKFSNSSGLYE